MRLRNLGAKAPGCALQTELTPNAGLQKVPGISDNPVPVSVTAPTLWPPPKAFPVLPAVFIVQGSCLRTQTLTSRREDEGANSSCVYSLHLSDIESPLQAGTVHEHQIFSVISQTL